MYRIFVPQKLKKPGEDILLKAGFEIVRSKSLEEKDLIEGIKGCDAAAIRTVKVTKNMLDATDKLKIIARHGSGYDGIDIKTAAKKKICVVNAPGANSTSVAELTIFYILYCSRNFSVVKNNMLKDYMYAKMAVEKHEISGKTLGLIGTGHIGNKVAKIAKFAFDMQIIAFDPFVKNENKLEFVNYTDREKVFKESDYISIHVPLTEETKNSISEKEFKMMKNTAYFINASRGELVDEEALYNAVKNQEIAGASLDTVKVEPIKKDNKLLELENILIAPHIGGATEEASNRASIMCAEQIRDYLNGKKPEHIIPEIRDLF